MSGLRTVAVLGVLTVGVAVPAAGTTGHARVSAGCAQVQRTVPPPLPAAGLSFSDLSFDAGEILVGFVSGPAVGSPTLVSMSIDGVIVDSAKFRAAGVTVQHTFPVGFRSREISFAVDRGAAVFHPHCMKAPVRTITGTAAGDVLIGTDGNEVIWGLGGADVLDGRGGDDLVLGGTGGDSMRGGDGHDRMLGGAGGDAINSRDSAPDDVAIGGDGLDAVVGDARDAITN